MRRFTMAFLAFALLAVLAVIPLGPTASQAESGGYGSSSSSSSGGYGAAPAASSGGYGAAPAASSGGYGAAPAASSGGYGASVPAAPAASSGGYGASAPAAPAASSGGYGSSAPAAPAASSGGYGSSAPAAPAASSGGYGSSAPAAPAATSSDSGGYGSDAPAAPAAPVQQAQAPAAPAGPAPAGLMFIVSAVLCGAALGWVLQRGRFCMNSAFRDTIFIKDFTYMHAYLLALAVAIIGANALNDLGMIHLSAQPFWPFAHIIGGYIFGLGIVLAGGCGSGIWFRVGEGQLNAWVAVLGFYIGIATTMSGLLQPLYRASRSVTLLADKPTLYQLVGGGESLMIKWGVIIAVCVAIGVYIRSSNPLKFGKQKGYYWSVTGVLLGLIAVFSFWASAKWGGGFARGLSFTTPTIEFFNTITRHDAHPTIFPIQTLLGYIQTTWGVFFIVAVPLGAFFSARGLKEFGWKVPPAKELLTVFGGSLMMGLGATLALGCNMGQGITGVSTLSVGSIFATIAIILGNWTMVYFKFIKPMQDELGDLDMD